jgi:hypothetical protein
MREELQAEKQRLVKKIAALKRTSGPGGSRPNFQRPTPRYELMHTCTDHWHSHGLLVIDADEAELEKD